MTEAIARRFRRFAEVEASGHSPLYETLCHGIATDPTILSFLASLPEAKQQPNLLLAAVRFVCGVQNGPLEFRAALLGHEAAVRAEMLRRRTQTNEPARCAVLLPALAQLPGPLALLEVGTSAGLCLLPDRYAYAYGTHRVDGHPDSPVLACQTRGPVPLPARSPQVVWRARGYPPPPECPGPR